MSIFEIIMLICFGASWPFAIHKTYVSKNPQGKSMIFLTLVIIGYICGALHKVVYYYDNVIYLYILNGVMVAIDMALTIYYLKQIRLRESAAPSTATANA